MVTKLLEYSYGKTSESRFAAIEVGPLLDSVLRHLHTDVPEKR